MALELFSYESMPLYIQGGPVFKQPLDNSPIKNYPIKSSSPFDNAQVSTYIGSVKEGNCVIDSSCNENTDTHHCLSVSWFKYGTDFGYNTDSVQKIVVSKQGEVKETYALVKSPNTPYPVDPGFNRGIRLLGFLSGRDAQSLLPDKEDYAYFVHNGFNIIEETGGLKFTELSHPSISETNSIRGILVVKVPSGGNTFTFSGTCGFDNSPFNFQFSKLGDTYTMEAGSCDSEPTVEATISLPPNFTEQASVVASQGYLNHTIVGNTVIVSAQVNPYYDNNRLILRFGWTEGGVLKTFSIYQKGVEEAYMEDQVREFPYNPLGRIEGIIGGITNIINFTPADSVYYTFTTNNNIVIPTKGISFVSESALCTHRSIGLDIEEFVNANPTTEPAYEDINIYYKGIYLGKITVKFLPRDLGLEFSPYDTTVTYDTVSPTTTLQRKMGNYSDLSFSIECITDSTIPGTITVAADRVVGELTYNDCEAHIPENLSGSVREWIVTAVYVDGDYRNQATWQIHQEPLEMEFDPDNEYIGAEGGTLESILSTNISDLSSIQFQGDIIPQLVSGENKTYSFVVPKNTDTFDKVYRTKAIVNSSSGSQEASYTVTQEKAAYSFVVNPSPIIVPAGNCTTMRLPVAVAQIVSTFQEMPTIRVRDARSGLEVTGLSRTEITVRALFNPWSNEINLGEIDFYIAGDLVATVEVKQEAAEFFGECVTGCPMVFPASGGQQTATISWNDNTITAEDFNWNISPWFSLETVYKGADSCGIFSIDLIVTAPVNNDLNNKEGQIQGTITGKEWSPVVDIVQQKAERKLYFGCTGHLNLPSMGTEAGTQKDCANCAKLFFNTPNEADVIISEAYGGLTMNVGPVEQEDTYLWSRRLCFQVGENLSPTPKKWSITATYGNKTAILRIDQKGALYLRCNPSTVVFYRNGGERFLYLETNIGSEDIEVIQSDSNVTLVPWGPNVYNVKAGPNFYKSKNSLITFRYKKDPTLHDSCRITQVTQQEGDNYLVCYPQLITDIPESGGTYVIEAITNLTEDKLGVEWGQQYPVPEGWQFMRDTTDYKKIIVTVPPYDSVRNAVVRWYGKNLGFKTECTSFIEQGTPTPPYLYFNPNSTRVSYRGGKVVTTLLSGWESEPSIDYSGLGNLKYTVEKRVFTKDCPTEDCPHGTTKTWTITIDVPETEDWADAVYLVRAEGPNNSTALFTLVQSGVPVTPSMDTGECKCNLLDNMGMEALNRYFKHLSQFGYKSYSDVNRLLVLLFINEILESDMELCISEEDYRVIMNALYCVVDKTCLADYPIEDVYDSLMHPDLTDPDTVRITEDDILRHSERGDIRTVL